jgi:uncharacterized membrane protein YfcA
LRLWTALLLGISSKVAVPLSKTTILGGSLGSMLFIHNKRHPFEPRPLIDFEVSSFMEAGELLGVTMGVVCNKIIPDVISQYLKPHSFPKNCYQMEHTLVQILVAILLFFILTYNGRNVSLSFTYRNISSDVILSYLSFC